MNAHEICILVADHDPAAAAAIARGLEPRGVRVRQPEGAESLLECVERVRPQAVFVEFPSQELEQLRKVWPELPLVAMSAPAAAADVVASLRAGADDFLPKPCDERELDRVLTAVRDWSVESGCVRPRAACGVRMRGVLDTVERVAQTDVTVLITGESGSGKEYVADLLRSKSVRVRKPFVKVNCAALPAQLLESELFGYERGAFTGAEKRKPGKFELAHRGTLFLDEISEMSPRLQAKLLQVLQEGCFSRLGGEADVRVDVRILAATHVDLRTAVREGRFREDLYYRLNVVQLRVPPLRERLDELPQIAETCLRRFAREMGRPCAPLPASLREAFLGYAWPGNVRELENMIKRWVVFESEAPILESLRAQNPRADAPDGVRPPGRDGELASFLAGRTPSVSLRRVAREAAFRAECRAIERVLTRTRWNRRRAAEVLRVSYKALLYKMKDAGLGAES